jgi:RsiW-degrading membrane proteinase PrsW (M82 family)
MKMNAKLKAVLTTVFAIMVTVVFEIGIVEALIYIYTVPHNKMPWWTLLRTHLSGLVLIGAMVAIPFAVRWLVRDFLDNT